ncbi:RNA 2',3'-cyclic phosphodiesterase [Actinocorallia sp. A-T 12471]|uniref:RNA 2',3'-cyclic phosphodiesterase n=1 Tax=Actinocorallia sp. A-T 12471 TaxID=3089813 RepID=UPI0029D3F0CB|nr:RNA 2',3'-cyclic phosphodiesterase [Actinocorallia sp. A-T 12471]MDX6738387.1 RNA 2',3'-cyclic phosphodiesterase [Actinocorallia sp. A-T 12471]
MRLFAALHPPAAVLDALAGAVEDARGSHPALHLTARRTWHLTLAFYGETDEPAAKALPGLLADAVAASRPPRLHLSGAGAFPTRTPGRAKVLWTGVEGDLAALADLAERCAEAGTRAGLDSPERSRPFHPHLTLARTRTPRDLRAPAALLAAFTSPEWTPKALDLMLSHYPSPGHTLLRSLPFESP